MKTTERNWSSIYDYEGGNFGYRAFFTREEWIEQDLEWSLDIVDDEAEDYKRWLNKKDDERLMYYIAERWNIEIRETTWLKAGNQCYYRGEVYTIEGMGLDINGNLDRFTPIFLTNGRETFGADLAECYGLTDKTCPRCGAPLYVSDNCAYPYVCVECDENFYACEC